MYVKVRERYVHACILQCAYSCMSKTTHLCSKQECAACMEVACRWTAVWTCVYRYDYVGYFNAYQASLMQQHCMILEYPLYKCYFPSGANLSVLVKRGTFTLRNERKEIERKCGAKGAVGGGTVTAPPSVGQMGLGWGMETATPSMGQRGFGG